MKIALDKNTLLIADADPVQFSIVRSWNLMKWDKQNKWLRGMASLELLEKLGTLIRLDRHPQIAKLYNELKAARTAVDKERVAEKPTPLYEPPVKAKLYSHQTRGYNMALLTFGWAEPESSRKNRRTINRRQVPPRI